MRFIRVSRDCFVTLFLAMTVLPALAQTYPVKTVRIVDVFPPGGGTDVVGRVIASKLTPVFGQSFVVENRPGAAGQVGTEQVIRARPDGHTLVVNPSGPILANPGSEQPAYDQARDLTPIALLTTFPTFLLVAPESPFQTLADLVA